MGYNEKELKAKLEKEKENIVLPSKKETIGDVLKNKRLETGKSIEEISDYLRIKSQYLLALEENKFNNLPGSAYVIGFIKSYASYLKLDVNNVIIQYKQEAGIFTSAAQPIPVEDENSIIKDPVINSNHIIIACAIVLFGIIFISITGSKESEPIVSEDLEISINNANITDNSLPTNNLEIPNFDNGKDIKNISTPEYFETKIGDADTKDVKIVEEKKDILPVKDTEIKDMESENNDHIAKEYGIENKENAEIYVKANKKVWIKLKKDGLYKYDSELGDIGSGVTIFETILDVGDVYYIPQGDDYYLTIGNAKGVDIFVNGEVIAPLSKKEVSRHNIEMNVEKLKNGTAYVKNRIVE